MPQHVAESQQSGGVSVTGNVAHSRGYSPNLATSASRNPPPCGAEARTERRNVTCHIVLIPPAGTEFNMPTDFIALFSVLTAARIRFVVVGGLAVLLHGLDRLTADVDLVIDLSTDAALEAVRALTKAGYRPLAPVDPAGLADSDRRTEWQTQRGMQVFSFWDSTNTRPTVDVMLSSAVPFEELWAEAVSVQIASTEARIASIPHLIRLKAAAGRPQDLADIERLRALLPPTE